MKTIIAEIEVPDWFDATLFDLKITHRATFPAVHRVDAKYRILDNPPAAQGEAVAIPINLAKQILRFTRQYSGANVDAINKRLGALLATQPIPAQPAESEPVAWPTQTLQDVYAIGFRRCARWADRDDLPHDVGSPAYLKDMATDLCGVSPQPAGGVPAELATLMRKLAKCAEIMECNDPTNYAAIFGASPTQADITLADEDTKFSSATTKAEGE